MSESSPVPSGDSRRSASSTVGRGRSKNKVAFSRCKLCAGSARASRWSRSFKTIFCVSGSKRGRTLLVRMLATKACCAADTFRSPVNVRCCTKCSLSAVYVRAAIDGGRMWLRRA
eukprot:857555-Pleurochrysis_carterae.AAC.2